MSNTLFLRLEGPLQSWGERGKWNVRDCAQEPTKSGVIGLVAAALGYNQDEQIRDLSEKLQMGARIDRPGTRLIDYHTIGGGSKEPMLLTAEGKPKKSSGKPHTEISTRDYLCDASFLVALQGDSALIEKMANALQNPVWVTFLGRKSCPPSRPIYDGIGEYPDLRNALEKHHWPKEHEHLLAVFECSSAKQGALRRQDHLFSRSYRVYGPRYTCNEILHRL